MRLFNIFLCGVVLSGMIIIGGCTEQMLRKIDVAAAKSEELVTDVNEMLRTPTGQMVPPEVKAWIVLAGLITSGLGNAWQKWRADQMKQTTKAIVKGIEVTESQQNPQVATVKQNIKTAMRLTSNYDRCNKIVDKLKVT